MIVDQRGQIFHLGRPIGQSIGRLDGFSAFGGAFGGEWEDWCDRGGANQKYGGEAWLCKYGSGWPVNPFLAPWTDVGNLARVLVAGAWPSDEEMEPYSLVTLPLLRPWRFAYIVWLAKLLAVTPLSAVGVVARAAGYAGVPIDQVPFVRSLAGLGSLPGIGVLPGGTHPEFIGLTPAGWLVAIGDTLRRFGPQGVYDKIVDPIVFKGGVEGILALAGGIPGVAAYAVRREAERMPPTLPIRAILLAISESSSIFAKFQNPKTLLEEGTFTDVGNALQRATVAVQGDLAYWLHKLGEALVTFGPSVSYLVRSPPEPERALNRLTKELFGVDFERFSAIKNDAGALNRQAGMVGGLEQNIVLLRSIVEWINQIFAAVDHVIRSPAISWVFSGELAALVSRMLPAVAGLFQAMIDAGARALNPPAHTAEPVQPTASLPVVRIVTPAKSVVVRPPLPPKPRAPGVGAPAAAGAGVGLLVGGPPGGLIGAGAGLIYGLTRKR